MLNEVQGVILGGAVGAAGVLSAIFQVEPLVFGATVFFAFIGVFAFKPVSFLNGLISSVIAAVSCLLIVPAVLHNFDSMPQASVAGLFTLSVTLSSKKMISVLKERPAILVGKVFSALEAKIEAWGSASSSKGNEK